jgi:hypothetical protein
MQAQTIQDSVIRDAMQQGMNQVNEFVREAFQEAGFPDAKEKTSNFLARGMLCNVSMALGMPDLMVKG